MVVGDDDGAVVPPSPVGSCRCCRSQKRPVLAAPPCRPACRRIKLTVLRDTTPCATPGDPSLVQCYWREEALAWRAVHARDQGKAPAPHNLQIGISGGAGRIWPGGGGRRLRVAQSGMGTTPPGEEIESLTGRDAGTPWGRSDHRQGRIVRTIVCQRLGWRRRHWRRQ